MYLQFAKKVDLKCSYDREEGRKEEMVIMGADRYIR